MREFKRWKEGREEGSEGGRKGGRKGGREGGKNEGREPSKSLCHLVFLQVGYHPQEDDVSKTLLSTIMG